jgi:pimeloyl-ACP methyl ester carboxylesterase
MTFTEKTVDVRGLNLTICEWGKENNSAPIVVLLHGFLDQGAAWHPVASQLSDAGYRVFAPDARGHGRSGHVSHGGNYHFPDYLSDLDSIVRQLEWGEFHLVGHSMGGSLACMYSATRPESVRSLVLIEGVGPQFERPSELTNKLITHLDQLATPRPHRVMESVELAARRMSKLNRGLSDTLALLLAKRATIPVDGGFIWSWDPMHRNRLPALFQRESWLELLKKIETPTSLIYGAQSPYINLELSSRESAISPTNVLTLDGGHCLHTETPNAVAAEILRHIGESPL